MLQTLDRFLRVCAVVHVQGSCASVADLAAMELPHVGKRDNAGSTARDDDDEDEDAQSEEDIKALQVLEAVLRYGTVCIGALQLV